MPDVLQENVRLIIQETADIFKDKLKKSKISFDDLKYSDDILKQVVTALKGTPRMQQLEKEFAEFFTWCNVYCKNNGFQPLGASFEQEITKNLISGIAANVGHKISGELGQTHSATNFMVKVSAFVGEDASRLKEKVVEAVVEGTKFPTNMFQFKEYFSKAYLGNNGKDGSLLADEAGFVNAVKDALAALEIDPNFLMLEVDDQKTEIQSFLNNLNYNRPTTSKEATAEINLVAEQVRTQEDFLSRHLKGQTGVVNVLNGVTPEKGKQGVIDQLNPLD